MAYVGVNTLEGPHTATIVEIVVQPNDSPQLRNILLQHLPEMLKLFIKKNSEYGAGDASSGTALGQKGQFADIWRKIGKLKTAIWDGNEHKLVTEGVNEILMDLIGHCFLTLHMRQLEQEQEYGSEMNYGIFTSITDILDSLPNYSDRDSLADVRNFLRERGWVISRPDGSAHNQSTDVDDEPWSMDQVREAAAQGDQMAQATLDTPDEFDPMTIDLEDEESKPRRPIKDSPQA